MEDEHESILLHSSRRRNKSSMSLSRCFGGGGSGSHHRGRSLDFDAFFSSHSATATADHQPEIKSRRNRNRRNSSADFSYDPQSYALNFEEPSEMEEPISSFISRLPSSPPRGRVARSSRADAIAEVKSNLDISASMDELKRRGVDVPTPRRPRW